MCYLHGMHQFQHYRRRKSGILMPFLAIIIIGLIVVFAFQIWLYFAEQKQFLTENKAAVTMQSGTAEMLVWGDQKWVKIYDGSLLREGDAVRTGPDAQLSMSLLNKGVVRVGGNTELSIEHLESKDGQDGITLVLKKGDVWLKRSSDKSVATDSIVLTESLTVRSLGTVFAVSKRDDTAVRVLEGAVAVDIQSDENGNQRVIETVQVGVGQEVVIGARELLLFKQRQGPRVLF
ncbi:MAG: hypothetical protein UY05_C0018G0023, partial [Candidatus Peregrinibacteria bacterium GW2011_GWA2_47_7]